VQSPDITNGFDVYLKAMNDEQLANKAYGRAKKSFRARRHFSGPARAGRRHGEGCEKADLVAADEQLNTLGVWLASGLIRASGLVRQMLGRKT
jgi:cobalt-zinc-cadmium efflux system membrane fusion protein